MFPQLTWELNCIGDNLSLRVDPTLGSPKSRHRRYPIRMLRYWFTYQLLRTEFLRRKSPLAICEIGIGKGQMLRFMNALAHRPGAAADDLRWSRWVGVDCHLAHDQLRDLGYHALIETNLEDPAPPTALEGYDALVLLHVLEHVHDPEAVVARIAGTMKPGSILIGGYPSVPHGIVPLRESKIRKTARANGHVSVFSARRTVELANACGLRLEFLAGAYFVRAGGFILEDYAWWIRFNLLFGAVFLFWPGEVYWVMRKPETAGA